MICKRNDTHRAERRHDVCATSNNLHGYRGVDWDGARGMYRARVESAPGTRGRWLGRFVTAREAALAYDDEARRVYGSDAHLNFPGPGEKATKQSAKREGFCPNGHSYAQHGYKRPDGRGVTCRVCNRAAAARRYAKKTRRPDSASPTPTERSGTP